MRPSRSIPIFSRLVSTQVTSTPISAKQAPDTSPTYPVPTIVIFIRRGYLSHLPGQAAAAFGARGVGVALFHLHRRAGGVPLHLLGEGLKFLHGGPGPGVGSEAGEVALRDVAGRELLEQSLDLGEEFAVVGGRSHDEGVVAEDVAQHVRNVGRREVVDRDRTYALRGQRAGDFVGELLRVAVHRAVGQHHAPLARVAAQAVVDVEHARNFALPYGAVCRADRLDGQCAELGQRLLHRHAVFAHDAGVVAAHLVPVVVEAHLAVGDAAVERPEGAECVGRKERPVLGAVGNHHLGPVHHRCEVEREREASAQVERVALLDLQRVVGDAVVACEHLEGLGVADDPHVGVDAAQHLHR